MKLGYLLLSDYYLSFNYFLKDAFVNENEKNSKACMCYLSNLSGKRGGRISSAVSMCLLRYEYRVYEYECTYSNHNTYEFIK